MVAAALAAGPPASWSAPPASRPGSSGCSTSGYGVIGGIGLGIGYISPVSTLIKWFPDRPGLATGLAIMGFGGGALVASPVASKLLAFYDSGFDAKDATSVASGSAVASMFVTLGVVYLVVMLFGAWLIKVPADGWRPDGLRRLEGQDRSDGDHRERQRRATRSRPRSSGCSGSCCSATSPRASASSSRLRR